MSIAEMFGSQHSQSSASVEETQPMISIRILNIDYYVAPPTPLLTSLGGNFPLNMKAQYPIIRIFGSTPGGQKTCAHIHGVLPYFFVRREDDPMFESATSLAASIPKIIEAVDSAMTMGRQPSSTSGPEAAGRSRPPPMGHLGESQGDDVDPQYAPMEEEEMQEGKPEELHGAQRDGQSKAAGDATAPRRKTSPVAAITIVKGVPFYGFHSEEALFLKVSLFSPSMIKPIATVFQRGAVLNKEFQPYEAHVPYLLQFFIDFNLTGMGMLELKYAKFRPPLPEEQDHLEAEDTPDDVSASTPHGNRDKVWIAANTPITLISGGSYWQERVEISRLESVPTSQTPADVSDIASAARDEGTANTTNDREGTKATSLEPVEVEASVQIPARPRPPEAIGDLLEGIDLGLLDWSQAPPPRASPPSLLPTTAPTMSESSLMRPPPPPPRLPSLASFAEPPSPRAQESSGDLLGGLSSFAFALPEELAAAKGDLWTSANSEEYERMKKTFSTKVVGRYCSVDCAQFSTPRGAWYRRQTTCALELDAVASSILNPRDRQRNWEAAMLSASPIDSESSSGKPDRSSRLAGVIFRSVQSMAELWEEEQQRQEMEAAAAGELGEGVGGMTKPLQPSPTPPTFPSSLSALSMVDSKGSPFSSSSTFLKSPNSATKPHDKQQPSPMPKEGKDITTDDKKKGTGSSEVPRLPWISTSSVERDLKKRLRRFAATLQAKSTKTSSLNPVMNEEQQVDELVTAAAESLTQAHASSALGTLHPTARKSQVVSRDHSVPPTSVAVQALARATPPSPLPPSLRQSQQKKGTLRQQSAEQQDSFVDILPSQMSAMYAVSSSQGTRGTTRLSQAQLPPPSPPAQGKGETEENEEMFDLIHWLGEETPLLASLSQNVYHDHRDGQVAEKFQMEAPPVLAHMEEIQKEEDSASSHSSDPSSDEEDRNQEEKTEKIARDMVGSQSEELSQQLYSQHEDSGILAQETQSSQSTVLSMLHRLSQKEEALLTRKKERGSPWSERGQRQLQRRARRKHDDMESFDILLSQSHLIAEEKEREREEKLKEEQEQKLQEPEEREKLSVNSTETEETQSQSSSVRLERARKREADRSQAYDQLKEQHNDLGIIEDSMDDDKEDELPSFPESQDSFAMAPKRLQKQKRVSASQPAFVDLLSPFSSEQRSALDPEGFGQSGTKSEPADSIQSEDDSRQGGRGDVASGQQSSEERWWSITESMQLSSSSSDNSEAETKSNYFQSRRNTNAPLALSQSFRELQKNLLEVDEVAEALFSSNQAPPRLDIGAAEDTGDKEEEAVNGTPRMIHIKGGMEGQADNSESGQPPQAFSPSLEGVQGALGTGKISENGEQQSVKVLTTPSSANKDTRGRRRITWSPSVSTPPRTETSPTHAAKKRALSPKPRSPLSQNSPLLVSRKRRRANGQHQISGDEFVEEAHDTDTNRFPLDASALRRSHEMTTEEERGAGRWYIYGRDPPPPAGIVQSLAQYLDEEGRPLATFINQPAYFSDPRHVPEKNRDWGGRTFHFPVKSLDSLKEFDTSYSLSRLSPPLPLDHFLSHHKHPEELLELANMQNPYRDGKMSFLSAWIQEIQSVPAVRRQILRRRRRGQLLGRGSNKGRIMKRYKEVLRVPAALPPSPEEVEQWLHRHPAPSSNKELQLGGGQSRNDRSGQPQGQRKAKSAEVLFDSNTGQLLPSGPADSSTAVLPNVSSLRNELTEAAAHLSGPKVDKRDVPSSGEPTLSLAPQNSMKFSKAVRSIAAQQNLTQLSLEIHVGTRGDLLPDPKYDAILAICYTISYEEGARNGFVQGVIMHCDGVDKEVRKQPRPTEQEIEAVQNQGIGRFHMPRSRDTAPSRAAASMSLPQGGGPQGVNATEASGASSRDGLRDVKVEIVATELELLDAFVDLIREWDPDFFVGFEVQSQSYGYLLERAQHLEVKLVEQISRTPSLPPDRRHGADEWGLVKGSGFWVSGRIVLNLWRIMRSQVKLNIYSFENIVLNVLKKQTPYYHASTLTKWYREGGAVRWRTLDYHLKRSRLNLDMLDILDVLGRTSEMARLFGIDFFSVLTRGSQFRVEAVMLRITKPLNYVLVSPSRQQVARQKAMETIPLVCEPQSMFYHDPVVVLDFQSLYPSIVIAYNMCYSTCLGKLNFSPEGGIHPQLGVLFYTAKSEDVVEEQKNAFISPNGVVFVSKSTREGVLPRMLREILDTRVMLKKSMDSAEKSGNRMLQRTQNARQFALKMIANVTYGYTSAGFSGRMPCAEIADAIVQTGRSTLEHAIQIVESDPKWNARVAYGDTDSLFVHLPGRSKEEAFAIGREISDRITAANPFPMRLKLEKVYMGSLLVTKKRYVGYKFESPQQEQGTFDAKGIETVRRDSCPLVAKTMEKSLRLLFKSRDLSKVRIYLEQQWTNILKGTLGIKDFIFAKEVRLGTYSENGLPPPAAIVASRAMARDPRAEPKYAERVPYVVVCGDPNARLVDLVLSPHEYVKSADTLRLNAVYYITKQVIPSMERLFNLVGVDIKQWYMDMKRPFVPAIRRRLNNSAAAAAAKAQAQAESVSYNPYHYSSARSTAVSTIDRYYLSQHCPLCNSLTKKGFCDTCLQDKQKLVMSKDKLLLNQDYNILDNRRIYWKRERAKTDKATKSSSKNDLTINVIRCCLWKGDFKTLYNCSSTSMRCSGEHSTDISCVSLDCPVYFARAQGEASHAELETYRQFMEELDF